MNHPNYIQTAIEAFGARHPEIELTESPVSANDIMKMEKEFHITIPDAVKAYLQSYTISAPLAVGRMLGDFSETYCEETGGWRGMEIGEEVAATVLRLPLMFPDFGLGNFEEFNRIFAGTGYLWLGLYNEEYYVLLELQSGKVWNVDMGRVRTTSVNETRADILRWALPFFRSFEDLVRCFFEGRLYDEDEMAFAIE